MVLLVVKQSLPECFASRGVKGKRPLLAFRLRGGEGSIAGHYDPGLATANCSAPQLIRSIAGPLSKEAGGRIDIVAIIGQESDIVALPGEDSRDAGQQDHRVAAFAGASAYEIGPCQSPCQEASARSRILEVQAAQSRFRNLKCSFSNQTRCFPRRAHISALVTFGAQVGWRSSASQNRQRHSAPSRLNVRHCPL